MNNPHDPYVAYEAAKPDALRAAEWLRAEIHLRGRVRISSIGPSGTSAHGVLGELQRRFPDQTSSPLDIELFSSFQEAAGRVLEGTADYALVPSAYRDATAFHWHPELELAYVFVHRTPEYGLATQQDATLGTSQALVVASMDEIEELFFQLAPPNLLGLSVKHVKASSTSDAAAIVKAGGADVAVCNDLGRQEHGLFWIGKREGVEMVWMLFKRRAGVSR